MASTKDGYGFIRCAERDARMFFHFSELLEPDTLPRPGDEVEMTVVPDPAAPAGSSRLIAIRIGHLQKGTVSFETVRPDKCEGVVEKEPATHKSPGNCIGK